MRYLVALILMGSAANAQQQSMDPVTMERVIGALRTQREVAMDNAVREAVRADQLAAQVKLLQDELDRRDKATAAEPPK